MGSPTDGCRILTGRQTSSGLSSLNVSWVKNAQWASISGYMNVPVIVVSEGDIFESITGIMTYSFGNMRLLPRNNADIKLPTIFADGFEDKAPSELMGSPIAFSPGFFGERPPGANPGGRACRYRCS